MPKNTYPEAIFFHGQKMDARISMKKEFKKERQAMRLLPFDHPDNSYLSKEKQEKLITTLSEDGFFVNPDDEFLDGEYNFVLTCEESPQLLCHPDLHHSTLANGKKVLASGTLFFKSGTLKVVTNNSGHYRPTDEEMLPFIKKLYELSGGTLNAYTSYCTSPTRTYSVTELFEIDDFSKATPLKENETIDAVTSKRTSISNYDILNQDEEASTRRFGRKLSPVLNNKYQDIIEKGAAFFKPNLGSCSTDTERNVFSIGSN
ncbi:hypothetical protein [Legionella hackeliae]|uniref:Uncharacterized protein n=1 Tax=Legionella hackeliae TaxID=449 RepID=A0A0A8UTQ7_LEGHA|nr:hypothetical protein [Legionella hackeliae]KTD10598.1 hypothetical protein Lhac_2966 [Legionella hackeliae]CEK10104.1 conserved protein of unknown function [Legionella hackeliae]STX46829.1 Uncharacterised protein [Legionella hackeliae]